MGSLLAARRMSLQLTLVRSAWSELFTLGLAQCAEQLSLPALLSALASHLRTASPKNGSSGTSQRGLVAEHVATLQRLVGALQRLRLDDREYALLRAMVLFCPGERSDGMSRPCFRLPGCIADLACCRLLLSWWRRSSGGMCGRHLFCCMLLFDPTAHGSFGRP